MKKVFLSIAFLLIAQMSMAQEADYKANVLKMISISGADAQMKVVKPQIMNMIPEGKKEIFSKEFDASLPTMYDKIAKIYMEIYTQEDIKVMIAFYESPVGKKMNEKAGELGQKSIQAGQEWAKELQVMMEKYKEVAPVQNKYNVTLPK